jgi:hypothetical protein
LRDIEADTVPSKDPLGKFRECFKECEEAAAWLLLFLLLLLLLLITGYK